MRKTAIALFSVCCALLFLGAGPYSSQVQAALRNFLIDAHTWTGAQTFGSAGSSIKQITIGTCNVDPPSILTISRNSAACTITGAAAGDGVICQPPSTLAAGLIFSGCEVTGTDTITVYFGNLTLGSIDDTSRTWRIIWVDVT